MSILLLAVTWYLRQINKHTQAQLYKPISDEILREKQLLLQFCYTQVKVMDINKEYSV